MLLCGLLGIKGFVAPDEDFGFLTKHSYTGDSYTGDDNSFGGEGKMVGLICGSLALVGAYCVCNIELYSSILPTIGLRKIRELHLDVIDGTIDGEEEIENVVIQIQIVRAPSRARITRDRARRR